MVMQAHERDVLRRRHVKPMLAHQGLELRLELVDSGEHGRNMYVVVAAMWVFEENSRDIRVGLRVEGARACLHALTRPIQYKKKWEAIG
eukprot:3856438-Pleurochrysis_carterae.AAC.1